MELVSFDKDTIYKFVSDTVKTNMYFLIKDKKALVIDPHKNIEMNNILKEHQVQDVVIFLTHEHPDHTYGVPFLVNNFKTEIICQNECAKAIADQKSNRPVVMLLYLKDHKTEEKDNFLKNWENYTINANITFDNDFEYEFGEHKFKFIHAPGHSKGGCLIYMDDKAAFTGDNLILNTPVITRFPGGNKDEYNSITKPLLDAFDDEVLVLPGHGSVFKMKEARQ